MARMGHPPNTVEKMMARWIDSSGGADSCWPWLGHTNRRGYGTISFEGRTCMSHRIMYTHLVGPIPDGMTVHHLCFNTGCQNPRHMALLTRSENARLRISVVINECRRGHDLLQKGAPMSNGGRYCTQCSKDTIAARKLAIAAGEVFTPRRTECRRGHPQSAMRQGSDGYWRCQECRRMADSRRRQLRRSTA